MSKHIIAGLSIIAVALSPATAQAPAPTPTVAAAVDASTSAQSDGTTPPTFCDKLNTQWSDVRHNIIGLMVKAIGDDSAPRATMRQVETGNEILKAQLIFNMMLANKCPLPTFTPW